MDLHLPQTSKTICQTLTLKLLSVILRELTFDNFETILLEFKTVYHMTGNLGRVRRNSILMCTGNGQVRSFPSSDSQNTESTLVSRVLLDSQ